MISDTVIEIQNLRKVYRLGSERVVALDDVSLKIERGEICCIFGTSGSGKSTLLNMIAGLEKPTKGDVKINGVYINKLSEKRLATFRQKYIGFVFQSYNLIPTLTAVENVALPLVFRGVGARKRKSLAKKILKDVGLPDHYNHKPTQMSGGQQQRTGIARAFVSKPAVIFADEPTGNLDSKTTAEVMNIMLETAKTYNQTLVIVTHEEEIAKYADRIIRLLDGNVVADYKVEKTENTEDTENTDNTEQAVSEEEIPIIT